MSSGRWRRRVAGTEATHDEVTQVDDRPRQVLSDSGDDIQQDDCQQNKHHMNEPGTCREVRGLLAVVRDFVD